VGCAIDKNGVGTDSDFDKLTYELGGQCSDNSREQTEEEFV